MPGMPLVFRRRSFTISSAVGRSEAGLSRMKMRPVFMTTLEPLAPIAEKYELTYGCWPTMPATLQLVLHHALEGDVLRGLGEREDLSGVLVGNEALGNDHEEVAGQHERWRRRSRG